MCIKGFSFRKVGFLSFVHFAPLYVYHLVLKDLRWWPTHGTSIVYPIEGLSEMFQGGPARPRDMCRISAYSDPHFCTILPGSLGDTANNQDISASGPIQRALEYNGRQKGECVMRQIRTANFR